MNAASRTFWDKKHRPWRGTFRGQRTLPTRTARPWRHWKKRTEGGPKVLNLRKKASNLTETRISHEQKMQLYQFFKWCPGAESNHRHEDFQSTALPLSYPGTGNASAFGCRRSRRGGAGCPEELKTFSMWFCRLLVELFKRLFDIFGIVQGDRIVALDPLAQVDICATFGAKRTIVHMCVRFADGAAHIRISLSATRSRFLWSSKWPRGVHPTSVVSTVSARKAARSAVSNCRRSFLAIGARSSVI